MWGRQSNGTCTASFEEETSTFSTRYTRNNAQCRLFDDEGSYRELSNTKFERELLHFDLSLSQEKRQAVVFYGSSSIRLWSTLASDFSTVPNGIINRGFGGSTLEQCWRQFKRIVLPLEPRVLIIYAGGNDITNGKSSVDVESSFLQLIQSIRRFCTSLPIVYISTKPSPSRFNELSTTNDINNRIRNDIQSMDNVNFINIFDEMLTFDKKLRPELYIEDNLHMNADGYAIWTRAINDYLKMKGLISNATMNRESLFLLEKIALSIYLLLLLKIVHAIILRKKLKNLMFCLKAPFCSRFTTQRKYNSLKI